MELSLSCIEARALKKSSFLSELAVTVNSQNNIIDDIFSVNGQLNGVSGDEFCVDGFLDFSNEDFDINEELVTEEKDLVNVVERENVYREFEFSGNGESKNITSEDLSVPVDDMENLEWLSQIVDDSASELSLLCPAGNYIPKSETTFSLNRFKPPVRTHTPVLCFPSSVPAKARTKRARTGGKSWSSGSPESSGNCSPTSTLIYPNTAWNVFRAGLESMDYSEEVVKPPPAKRGRKKPLAADDGGEASPLIQRRCSHCQVQKTPQWRNGPHGPKTLCNACGVRFKSGRLFPEYRPACSPTFSGEVHSNSHRKVLEMRRKKETIVTKDEPGLVM